MADQHEALAVVKRYIDFSGTLDADSLSVCFAPHATLCGFLGPTQVVGDIEIYLSDVRRLAKEKSDMTTYSGTVTAFDAKEGVASATVAMNGFAGARFVDYLLLMRQEGGWRIVSKAFTTI